MSATTITLGVPSAGHPQIEFVNSLAQLITGGKINRMLIVPRLPVHQARTRIAKELDTSHLLFVDDDMVFPPEALDFLIEADKDIVSGLYVRRTNQAALPVVFGFDGDRFRFVQPPDRLAEVGGVSLAFTLIKKAVFESIGPQFNFTETMGEDLEFIKRAKAAGFETWLEPRAVIGHIHETVLEPGSTIKAEV